MFSQAARESEILAAIKDYLDLKGIFHFRVNQIPVPLPGGGFRRFAGTPGVSDLIAVFPKGRICCIEVKSARGKESEAQEQFLEKIYALGGIAIVAHSVEELEADLREAGVIS